MLAGGAQSIVRIEYFLSFLVCSTQEVSGLRQVSSEQGSLPNPNPTKGSFIRPSLVARDKPSCYPAPPDNRLSLRKGLRRNGSDGRRPKNMSGCASAWARKCTRRATCLSEDRDEAPDSHYVSSGRGDYRTRPVRDRHIRAQRARVRFHARDRMASRR